MHYLVFRYESPIVHPGAPDTVDTLRIEEEMKGPTGPGDTDDGRNHAVSAAMNDLSIKEEVRS